jgi:hypothetical protein
MESSDANQSLRQSNYIESMYSEKFELPGEPLQLFEV